MEISVTGRHLELTEAERDYAIEKFSKAERLFRGVQSIEVIIKEEDRKKHCECIVHTKASDNLVVDVARDEVLEAIDVAIDKCERQLRRLKEKTTNHRRKSGSKAGLMAETDSED